MGCSKQSTNNLRHSLGCFGLEYVNDAGRRFLSYLAINNMLAITTCFRKKRYATWVHPRSKLQHQIDHFFVKKDKSQFFTDACVTQPIIDTDHNAVLCKLHLINRLKKRSNPRQRLLQYDYYGLKNREARETFCVKVFEAYNAQTISNSKYNRFAAAVTSVSRNNLPRKSKPSPGWFTSAQQTLIPLIHQRNQAMLKKFQYPLRSTVQKLRVARKELKRAISKAKNDWISAFVVR